MTTTRLCVHFASTVCAVVLGLALPGVSARAHDGVFPCKQVADREQRRACEYRYWRFHECREDWRSCGFGSLGDSQLDEYQGFSNMAGYNWLEQLARVRGLDFGPYEADPTVRGEPRNNGYAYDWARDSASVTSPTWADVFDIMGWSDGCLAQFGSPICPGGGGRVQALGPFSAQVAGLSAQVSAGEVQVVVMMMGINDFKVYQLLGGTFTGPAFDQKSAEVIAGLVGAVDALQAADPVMILVGDLPTRGFDPVFSAAMADVNARLAAELASRGVAMFDQYAYFDDPGLIRVTPQPDGTSLVDLMVGSYAMPLVPMFIPPVSDLVAPDDPRVIGPCRLVGWQWRDPGVSFSETPMCATLEYELSAFLDDATHVSTLASGLTANVVLRALDESFGLEIPRLRPSEILCSAGIVEPGHGRHHQDCGHDGR